MNHNQYMLLQLLSLPNRFYRNKTVFEGSVIKNEISVTPLYSGNEDDLFALERLGYVRYVESACPYHSEFVITDIGRKVLSMIVHVLVTFWG